MTRAGPAIAVLAVTACTPVCDAGRICAVIGSGDLGFNGDGMAALKTRLASPTSVTTDLDGRTVVVDYSNMRIRVLTEAGTVETLVGNGIHAYSEPGAPALETPLENPVDAAWGPDGLLYVLPQHEGRVVRITPSGTIEVAAGTGLIGDAGDGGDALDAEMGYGAGLAIGADGSMYVSDNTWSRVRRIDPDGGIDTVLGTGEPGLGAPGRGPAMAIRNPERLVVDDAGRRLIVTDTLNHRVIAVDLDSLDATVLAGTGERGWSGDGGPAEAARLDQPVGVAVRDGVVVIADLGNDVLRAVGLDGVIDVIAGGEGDAVRSGDARSFPLRGPAGMAFTEEGDLIIAERTGQRVLRWTGASDAL